MFNSRAEAFAQITHDRRSVRAFTKQQASPELLKTVFSLAQRAPSNCNTQPWQTAVVTGDRCRKLSGLFREQLDNNLYQMDFPYTGQYQGAYRDRQVSAASELYSAMGIDRADKAARHEAFLRNFDFFGAPHAAFLFLPENFGLREATDLGMYAQNLMLSLTAHGLVSCPQTALGFACDTVRQELQIDSSMRLLFGISFGYEDKQHPANNCRTPRAEIDECVQFFN
ncbi:nitroreductase [Endozoicomonas sp. OPT23]|uniref:nitroreductase n=1 Tax=Endozoicomonas sp. OPT23 TaxID=2072845 RepID=UPI00129BEBC7|nr:nitroreductase [Endozoicomonas sp. OPT23]MRI33989.1 nitroreductase [Endozoicomonas sp. OPT23]